MPSVTLVFPISIASSMAKQLSYAAPRDATQRPAELNTTDETVTGKECAPGFPWPGLLGAQVVQCLLHGGEHTGVPVRCSGPRQAGDHLSVVLPALF